MKKNEIWFVKVYNRKTIGRINYSVVKNTSLSFKNLLLMFLIHQFEEKF